MADTDVVRGEEAALKKAQWRKLSESIQRDWHRTGYQPHAHLQTMTHEGDTVLLQRMAQQERTRRPDGRMPEGVSWYMAWRDLTELWDHYAAQTFRQRAKAG